MPGLNQLSEFFFLDKGQHTLLNKPLSSMAKASALYTWAGLRISYTAPTTVI